MLENILINHCESEQFAQTNNLFGENIMPDVFSEVENHQVPKPTNDEQLIQFSIFNNCRDNKAKNFKRTFDELENICLEYEIQNTKEKISAICPATFLDDKRADSNVIACSFLGIDLDDLPETTTIGDVQALMSDTRGFIYTTHSHLEPGKGARFRVIIKLNKPIVGELYRELYVAIGSWFSPLGGKVDNKCQNPSRLLYVPAVHEDRTERFQFMSNPGMPLVWSEYVSTNFDKTRLKQKKTSTRLNNSDDFMISEGSRNNDLFIVASRLRKTGKDKSEILDALKHTNQYQCNPPLDHSELVSICESVIKHHANEAAFNSIYDFPRITQSLIARAIAEKYNSTIKFIFETKQWIVYDNSKYSWIKVSSDSINRIVEDDLIKRKKAIASMIWKANGDFGKQIAEIERNENYNFISGTVKLLRSQQGVAISIDELDCNKHHVGLRGGKYYDLDTLTVQTIIPDVMITKSINASYEPDATCPLWEKCMLDWCQNDRELVIFLQTWCGYSLSGNTDYQKFLFLYGGGKNGKSVFVNTISNLINNYAANIQPQTLMMKYNNNGASGDIARLSKIRLATAIELPDGQAFDDNLLKQLTGGDTMTARYLYQEAFEFTPELKLMICGNHKPAIKGFDEGIWRRVMLVPFTANISKTDPYLTSKLADEFSGILNWCLEGWKRYQSESFKKTPKCIEDATNEYRYDMDYVQHWFSECVVESPRGIVGVTELFKSFDHWCDQNGYKHGFNRNKFVSRITSMIGSTKRNNKGIYFSGIKLTCYAD